MNMLLVNDVYQHGKKRFRILWRDSEKICWIDIDGAIAMPEFIQLAALIKLLEDESIAFVKDPYESFLMNLPVDKAWAEKIQQRAWSSISVHVTKEPDIFDPQKRGTMVQEIRKTHGITKQTIYKNFRLYWQRGKNPNALYPDTRQWGGPGKIKNAGKHKRGRPRSVSRGVGVNIDSYIADTLRSVIKVHYMNTKNNSITHVYKKTLIALGIDKTKATETELAEALTYEQFYHFLRKEIGANEKMKARFGEVVWNKDIRPVLGTSASEVMGPGSRYQIDATIGDVYLLSSDRCRIIGRPVIYVVVDVFSRLIVGLYVGLEGPSWVSAMIALANAMGDNVKYCAKYDISIKQEEWPGIGKPESILGDRGEMLATGADTMCDKLFIVISNTPPHRADWKGIVERNFNTLQAKFKPYVEGYVTGEIGKKRAGKDYRLDAELTLKEMTQLIIRCVLQYNNTHVIRNYDADSDMPPELPHNPLALWNWGTKNRTGKLRSVGEDILAVNLLPHSDASITEEGIKLFGCFYTTAMAIQEGWFVRHTGRPRKVKVAYDPHNANTIYVRPPETPDLYVACELTERSREFRDLTFWDVWRIRDIKAETKASAELTKTKGELNLEAEIEKITREARRLNPDTSMISNSARTKGIRKNRSEEKDHERKKHPGMMNESFTCDKSDTCNENVVYINGKKPQDFSVPQMLTELFGESDE